MGFDSEPTVLQEVRYAWLNLRLAVDGGTYDKTIFRYSLEGCTLFRVVSSGRRRVCNVLCAEVCRTSAGLEEREDGYHILLLGEVTSLEVFQTPRNGASHVCMCVSVGVRSRAYLAREFSKISSIRFFCLVYNAPGGIQSVTRPMRMPISS